MRNLLREQGHSKFNLGTTASMLFLNATDPSTIKLTEKVLIDWGYGAQHLAHGLAKRLGMVKDRPRDRRALGTARIKAQIVHFINNPMPSKLPTKTSRALLDVEDDTIIPIIRDPTRPRRTQTRYSIFLVAVQNGCSQMWV